MIQSYILQQKNIIFHMNKQIPISNRICFYHDLKRAWDIHESKITNQIPLVDCQQPSTLTLRSNQTFRGLSTNRKDQIERENNHLLKKLLDLNQTKQGKNGFNFQNPYRCLPNLSEINKNQRERKLKKIAKQNRLMNSRLSNNTASSYSMKAMHSSRQKNKNYLQLISRYPVKNQNNKAILKLEMKNSPQKYNNTFHKYSQQRSKTYQNTETQTAQITSVLNGVKYRITGEYNPTGIEIILRNHLKSNDKHTLQINSKQTGQLYKEVFCQSLKSILQSVSYDANNSQFFLKLPDSNEF